MGTSEEDLLTLYNKGGQIVSLAGQIKKTKIVWRAAKNWANAYYSQFLSQN